MRKCGKIKSGGQEQRGSFYYYTILLKVNSTVDYFNTDSNNTLEQLMNTGPLNLACQGLWAANSASYDPKSFTQLLPISNPVSLSVKWGW